MDKWSHEEQNLCRSCIYILKVCTNEFRAKENNKVIRTLLTQSALFYIKKKKKEVMGSWVKQTRQQTAVAVLKRWAWRWNGDACCDEWEWEAEKSSDLFLLLCWDHVRETAWRNLGAKISSFPLLSQLEFSILGSRNSSSSSSLLLLLIRFFPSMLIPNTRSEKRNKEFFYSIL